MQSDSRYAALRMPTHEMRPRIRAGEAIVYGLDTKAEPGDDVVILLVDGGIIVRELIAFTADGYRLRAHSPATVSVLLATRVEGIYPIVLRGHPELVKEIEEVEG